MTKSRGFCCAALAVAVMGCNGPSGPAPPVPAPPSVAPPPTPPPPSPPPPGPTSARLQMSGRVLDENGAPVTGAVVEVDYSSGGGASNPPSMCPSFGQFCWLSTRTTDMGEYSVEFEPRPWPGYGLGYVYALRNGYEVDVQWVPAGPSPAVRDMRLRASRKIVAGASTTVTVEPTSSLCTDLEDLWALASRCEIVLIESGSGTLHVEAHAVSGGLVPSIYWYTTGNYAGLITQPGPGMVSIPARGGTYRVLVALPDGAAAHEFKVTTSLR